MMPNHTTCAKKITTTFLYSNIALVIKHKFRLWETRNHLLHNLPLKQDKIDTLKVMWYYYRHEIGRSNEQIQFPKVLN